MNGNIYLLQYASYISQSVMEENIKKLNNYITVEEDNKYYVYVGAFISLSNAEKLQKILESQNIYTYIKNDYIGNSKVIDKIDLLDKKALKDDKELEKSNNEILNILKNDL